MAAEIASSRGWSDFAQGLRSLATSTSLGVWPGPRRTPAVVERALDGRVCVVTGGTRGLGKAIAEALVRGGATVVLGCRDLSVGEDARRNMAPSDGEHRVFVERVDVASRAEVRAFASRIASRFERIDVLVNNAGASFPSRRTADDGLELTFATNVLGSFHVTLALRSLLRAAPGARVIQIGSWGQYLARLRTEAFVEPPRRYVHELVYVHTQRARFELSERWAEVLASDGIAVSCTHPGLVSTPGVEGAFPRYHRLAASFLRRPDDGADTAVWLAAAPETAKLRGGLWFDRVAQPAHCFPWTRAPDDERERLWQLCERLCQSAG